MSKFDELAKQWDLSPRRVLLAKKTFDEINEKVLLNDKMEVLDIGTGTGLLLLNFIDKVKHITGIDNSNGMLNVLKNKLEQQKIKNVSLKLFDANNDKLPGNTFNLVVSNMTFHHIKNVSSFIRQIYSCLKPGGSICIADLETEDGTFHDKNHLEGVFHYGFDKNEFIKWLEDANFKNTFIKTFFKIEKDNKKFPVFFAYGKK